MTMTTRSDLAVLQRLYDAQRRMECQPDTREAFDQIAGAMKEADEWLRRNFKPQSPKEAEPRAD